MKFIGVIFKTFILSVLMIAQVHFSYAQTASILPPAKTTFLDSNGNPLAGGKVHFYIPGTTSAKTTWQDSGETIPNANPVVLDSAGRGIILGDGSYRQQVFDKLGNLIWDQQTSSTGSGGGGGTTATVGDGDAVGTVKPWSGFVAPNAYAFAYGQTLARASFPLLFSTLTSQQNVSCTSGSAVLSGVSDTSQLPVGAAIESICLSAGATVVSTTISSVTASSNAIISTSTSARFFPFGNGDGSLSFNVPDLRGRVLAGRDNMGSIAANRLTSAATGFGSIAALGASGGSQSSTLAMTNLPASPAPVTAATSGYSPTVGGAPANAIGGTPGTASFTPTGGNAVYQSNEFSSIAGFTSLSVGSNTANLGSSTAFSNVQPTGILNYIIKTLPDTNPNSYFGVASIGGMTGVITCGNGLTCTANSISATTSVVLPPPTTTVLGGVFSDTCSTSNWFKTLDATGAFGCSQPNFTDLAGLISATQIPNNAVSNAKLSTIPAASFKGNPTASGPSNATDFTIAGLPAASSCNASTDYLVKLDSATGAFQKVNCGLIASAATAGVSSFNTRTGAVVPGSSDYIAPQIGYTAPGTGATAQTVANKLNQFLYASDFGAVCNGTTDDYAALQNEINEAQILSVQARFNQGCLIKTGLIITEAIDFGGTGYLHNVSVTPDGNASRLIAGTTGMTMLTVNEEGPVYLHNFEFDNGAGLASIIGLTLTSSITQNAGSIIRDVQFYAEDTCFNAIAAGSYVLDSIRFSACGTDSAVIKNTFHADSGDSTITNSTFGGNPSHSDIYQTSSGGLRLINNKFNSNTPWHYWLDLDAGAVTGDLFITANSFEAASSVIAASIRLDRKANTATFQMVSITGNELVGGSGGSGACILAPADSTGPWINQTTIIGNNCIFGSNTNSTGAFNLNNNFQGIIVANNTVRNIGTVAGFSTILGGSNCIVGPNMSYGSTFNASSITCTTSTTISPF